MSATTLHKTIVLKADKATVWDYLTQPDKLGQWFHRPKTPLVEGEPYALYGTESGDKLCWGEVISASPPDRLEMTFTVKPMADAESKVIWTLDAVPGGTRLSLEHSGLPESEAAFGLMMALDKGWDDHLGRLRTPMNEAESAAA